MDKKVGLSIRKLQATYGDMQALDKAKELGCDTVDFSLENRDYRREGDKYSLSDQIIFEYYSAIGRHAKEIGIEISQTHGRIRGYTLDPDECDVMAALKEVGYNGVYNMELNLDCFGKDLFLDTAALSVKIMRDILK